MKQNEQITLSAEDMKFLIQYAPDAETADKLIETETPYRLYSEKYDYLADVMGDYMPIILFSEAEAGDSLEDTRRDDYAACLTTIVNAKWR